MENKDRKEDCPLFVPFPGMLIDTDPQGSYTGVPEDEYEEPVQDVDDL